jgi:hypothetical protein
MKKLLLTLFAIVCIHISETYAQVPKLSSYPSAGATIFLDFDGHLVQGTSWNYLGPIDCGASTLTADNIETIFNRVAEDYRPFNVNITTDSVKFLNAPLNRRIRVIVTVSSSWYGSAGGVAFNGSFTWGDDTPAFVFSQLLGNNVKNVAEAISHEAGHTLGLFHQAQYDLTNCNKLTDYHRGEGTGQIGWAPIMGVGYYQNFTLWHNGSNSLGCNSKQNDLEVITDGRNGFGFRTDDHGSNFATSTVAGFTNNHFEVSGVIMQNSDNDFFTFTLPSSSRFELDAIPYNVGTGNAGSNLDMQVSLYHSSETLLNVYNPGNLLNSIIDTVLSGGTYYLKVEGRGNQYAPNYASLGSYALQATTNNLTPLPLRVLNLNGKIDGSNHRLNWVIDADEQIVNLRVEVSTDGRTFVPLQKVENNARSYSYQPVSKQTLRYRLYVEFDNGRYYYSNALSLQQQTTGVPKVIGNIKSNGQFQVSAPDKAYYRLFNFEGKQIQQGNLSAGINAIHIKQAVKGMYVIQYQDTNGQQYTDKLLIP